MDHLLDRRKENTEAWQQGAIEARQAPLLAQDEYLTYRHTLIHFRPSHTAPYDNARQGPPLAAISTPETSDSLVRLPGPYEAPEAAQQLVLEYSRLLAHEIRSRNHHGISHVFEALLEASATTAHFVWYTLTIASERPVHEAISWLAASRASQHRYLKRRLHQWIVGAAHWEARRRARASGNDVLDSEVLRPLGSKPAEALVRWRNYDHKKREVGAFPSDFTERYRKKFAFYPLGGQPAKKRAGKPGKRGKQANELHPLQLKDLEPGLRAKVTSGEIHEPRTTDGRPRTTDGKPRTTDDRPASGGVPRVRPTPPLFDPSPAAPPSPSPSSSPIVAPAPAPITAPQEAAPTPLEEAQQRQTPSHRARREKYSPAIRLLLLQGLKQAATVRDIDREIFGLIVRATRKGPLLDAVLLVIDVLNDELMDGLRVFFSNEGIDIYEQKYGKDMGQSAAMGVFARLISWRNTARRVLEQGQADDNWRRLWSAAAKHT
jgi:hypothetical protein